MPKYTINGVTFNSDRELTTQDLEALAAQTTSQAAPQAQQPQTEPTNRWDRPMGQIIQEEALKSVPARLIRGAVVEPVLGAAQLATGGQSQAINRAVDVVAQATKPEGFDVAGTAGMVVSPLNKLLSIAKGGRLMQAAGTGALQGAVSTVEGANEGDFALQKSLQVGLGSVFGPAAEGLVALSAKVYKVGSGLTQRGRQQALQEYLNGLAGPERQSVITALQDAKELVTGSRPTAAEALSDIPSAAELIALQQKTATQLGGPKGAFATREAQQAQARLDAINKIAGTPEQQAAIKERRNREAGRLREAALEQTDVAGGVIDRLESEMARKASSFVGALQEQGRAATTAAQQQNLANTFTPVPGYPRFPGRYTAMAERVPEYTQTSAAFGDVAAQRKREIQFLQFQKDSLEQNGFFPLRADDLVARLDSAARGTQNDMAKEIFSEFADRIRAKADENGILSSRDVYENIRKDLNRNIIAYLDKSGKKPMQGGLSEQEAKAAGTIKKFIDTAFDKSSDGLWSKYLDTYTKYSQKIDRMRVGEELASKLRTSLDEETAGVFANAVDNAAQTIKRAGTDIPRYQRLNQLLTPTEISTVNSVRADLERKSRAAALARQSGAAPEIQEKARLPQFLSATATIFNNTLDALQRGNRAEFNRRITELMLDPPKLAEFMTTQIPKGKIQEVTSALTAGMDDRTRRAFFQAFSVRPLTELIGDQ
jgi:hypothetical protein